MINSRKNLLYCVSYIVIISLANSFFGAYAQPKEAPQNTRALHATHQITPAKSLNLGNTFGNCLAQSIRGTLLIGCQDGSIAEWDVEKNTFLTHKAHTSAIISMIVCADGTIVSGDKLGILKLWDASLKNCLGMTKAHNGGISSITQLYDGRIATGSHDTTLKIWSLDGSTYTQLSGHTDWVNYLTAYNETTIVSCADDATIRFWDTGTRKCIATMTRPSQAIYHVLPTGINGLNTGIITSHENGSIYFWDTSKYAEPKTSWYPEHSIQYHEQAVTKTIISTQGSIITSSVDHTIMLVCGDKHQTRILFAGHTGTVKDMIEMKPGIIASCSHDRFVHLWNTIEQESAAKNNQSPQR